MTYRSLNAANSNMTHAGIDHLRLPSRGAIAQTVIGSTQERTAFDHLARNSKLRLAGIVALLRRGDARTDLWRATRLHDFVGAARNVPVRCPFPHVAGHVEQSVAVGREASGRGGSFKA